MGLWSFWVYEHDDGRASLGILEVIIRTFASCFEVSCLFGGRRLMQGEAFGTGFEMFEVRGQGRVEEMRR